MSLLVVVAVGANLAQWAGELATVLRTVAMADGYDHFTGCVGLGRCRSPHIIETVAIVGQGQVSH